MISLHLFYGCLGTVGLSDTWRAESHFLSVITKNSLPSCQVIELQSEVFPCECQHSSHLFVFGEEEGGGREAHLINSSPVTCSVFTPFVL